MADNSERRVQLKGELTVRRSADLKEELEEALSQSDRVLVDLGEASGFDLSFLQLMCAVQRRAQVLRKQVSLDGALPRTLQEILAAAGFLPSCSCLEICRFGCLWGNPQGLPSDACG